MVETGLPSKYAKMGFVKGWKAFKKTDAYKKRKGTLTKSQKALTKKVLSKGKTKKSKSNKSSGKGVKHMVKKVNIPVVGLMVAADAAIKLKIPDVINELRAGRVASAIQWFQSGVAQNGIMVAAEVAAYALAKKYLPRGGINLGPIRIGL